MDESKEKLQACFNCTDWSIFEAARTDLNKLTDTVRLYMGFCEDLCAQTKSFCTYNNNIPWFTLRKLCQSKEEGYSSRDQALLLYK